MRFKQVQRCISTTKYFGVRCFLKEIQSVYSTTGYMAAHKVQQGPISTHQPSCSTSSDQPVLASLLQQSVSSCGYESDACGAKWMANRQRATPRVELFHRGYTHLGK